MTGREAIREAAIREAIEVSDITAPSGGGKYSQGWIAARERIRGNLESLLVEHLPGPHPAHPLISTGVPGRIIIRGERVRVGKVMGRLVYILCRQRGQWLDWDDVILGVYTDRADEPGNPLASLRALLCVFRRQYGRELIQTKYRGGVRVV